MDFTVGKDSGFSIYRQDNYEGFLLMIFGWEVSYTHFTDEYVGIAWTRQLVIGQTKWWITDRWKVFAKKDKKGLHYLMQTTQENLDSMVELATNEIFGNGRRS